MEDFDLRKIYYFHLFEAQNSTQRSELLFGLSDHSARPLFDSLKNLASLKKEKASSSALKVI
jgi:hypothetical protein